MKRLHAFSVFNILFFADMKKLFVDKLNLNP